MGNGVHHRSLSSLCGAKVIEQEMTQIIFFFVSIKFANITDSLSSVTVNNCENVSKPLRIPQIVSDSNVADAFPTFNLSTF